MLENRLGGEPREGTGSLASADFSVIDVETANRSRASICQVGIVQVRNGALQDEWTSLVNPDEEFEWFCVKKHGIRAADVAGSPSFPEIYPRIRDLLTGTVTVSHSDFDHQAMDQSADRFGLPHLDLAWLDSIAVARTAWPDLYGQGGYGLKSLSAFLDFRFEHHDALEDARAAALVMLAACQARGCGAAEWLREVTTANGRERRPSDPSNAIEPQTDTIHSIAELQNRWGEVIVVFTGKLSTAKNLAKARAIGSGCTVRDSVTRETTALVVGVQSRNALQGHEKSTKQRKAEALVAKGHSIAIVSEPDFWELIRQLET